MRIKLLERAALASTWSPFSLYTDQCFQKMTCDSFQCLGGVQNVPHPFIELGWSLTIVAPNDVMSWWHLCSHNDHQPLLRSPTLSLAQNFKPSCKPICTKRQNYYHLIQSTIANLSLRPYLTISVQINPNLQAYIIKAVLILTLIPYQIPKMLKSNILKNIVIEILYLLYTYNQSYALVDHLLKPNRSCPIFRWAKSSNESRSNSKLINSCGSKSYNSDTNCNASKVN